MAKRKTDDILDTPADARRRQQDRDAVAMGPRRVSPVRERMAVREAARQSLDAQLRQIGATYDGLGEVDPNANQPFAPAPAPEAATEAAPATPAARQSYQGRDLDTGHLVGRQEFAGRPLSEVDRSFKIPDRIRQAAATADAAQPNDRIESDPQQIAAMRADITARQAEASTAVEREALQQEADKLTAQQDRLVMADATSLMRAARTDPMVAQMAPQLGEFMADVREVEQGVAAALEGGNETDISDAKEDRRTVMDSLSNFLRSDVANGFLDAAKQVEEQRQEEMNRESQQAFFQSVHDALSRNEQRETADMAKLDARFDGDLTRATNTALKQVEFGATPEQIEELTDQAERKAEQAHSRRVTAERDRFRLQRAQVIEQSLLDPTVPTAAMIPMLEQLWGRDVVKQEGAEAVLARTRTAIRETRQNRAYAGRQTGVGTFSMGDLTYAIEKNEDFRLSGINSPEQLESILVQEEMDFRKMAGPIRSNIDLSGEDRAKALNDLEARTKPYNQMLTETEIESTHRYHERRQVWDRLTPLVG